MCANDAVIPAAMKRIRGADERPDAIDAAARSARRESGQRARCGGARLSGCAEQRRCDLVAGDRVVAPSEPLVQAGGLEVRVAEDRCRAESAVANGVVELRQGSGIVAPRLEKAAETVACDRIVPIERDGALEECARP